MISIAITLWSIVAIGLLLGAYAYLIEPRKLQVTRKTVTIPHLPAPLEGFTIAHLSDLHCRPGSVNDIVARRAVQLAAESDADIIVITGDLAHGGDNLPEAIEVLRPLQHRDNVFVVLGNHDINWTHENLISRAEEIHSNWLQWVQALDDLGVTLLENECRVLEVNGCKVAIAGIGDTCSGRQDFATALDGVGEVDLRLLLNHSPDVLDFPEVDWADLVLCGHTHGGQWRLPGIGTLWAPVWRDFRRSAGLLRCGRTQCYVSRGVGSAVEIRINCPPELALLTLKRGPAGGRPCRRYPRPAAGA